MSGVWNLWEVKRPPVCTVKTKLHFKEINGLREITYNAVKTLTDLKILNKEAAILSRFLYKNKRALRHDKGVRKLVQVNQCLKRYLKLNLIDRFSSFLKCLPHKLSPNASFSYLPTKGMLKFILLSVQSFSQLFLRIITLTKSVAKYTHQKMCLGWSLNLSFLVFSMSARIFVSSKFLVTKSIEWYTYLYKCLPYLEETVQFLPDYKFPKNFKKWLGRSSLKVMKKTVLIDDVFEMIDISKGKGNDDDDDDDDDDDGDVKIVGEKLIENIFKSNSGNDSDIEEILLGETEEKGEEKEIGKGVKRPLELSINDEDLGVPVDEEKEIFVLPKKKRKKMKI